MTELFVLFLFCERCIESTGQLRSMEEADDAVDYLLMLLNVSSVDEMRSMNMSTIVNANGGQATYAVFPAVDNYVFPEHPLKLMENGSINGESVMIGTMLRESFTAEPWNRGWVPDDGEELVQFWDSIYDDSEVEMIEGAYPVDEEGIAEKVWSNPSIFDDNRSAVLVSTQLQTDCFFRCGSIRQTELISEHPITQNKSVYFYQMGFIEEPWDQVSHGADVNYLFEAEIFISVHSENFTKIVQDFFGSYIRGEGVMIDGDDASIQNGQYIHVVDEVKAMDLDELDMVKTRCEVMFDLDDDAFTNYAFCSGGVADFVSDDDDTANQYDDDDDVEINKTGTIVVATLVTVCLVAWIVYIVYGICNPKEEEAATTTGAEGRHTNVASGSHVGGNSTTTADLEMPETR